MRVFIFVNCRPYQDLEALANVSLNIVAQIQAFQGSEMSEAEWFEVGQKG